MTLNKMLVLNLDLDLSDKYLEVIIRCLELEIFNEKVDDFNGILYGERTL